MATELQSPPHRRPPVQLSGNVTTAVLVATAAADDGGPAAALPWGGSTLLDRLLQQVAGLGFEDVHVVTRPQFEETLRPAAERGGATVHVCAGPSEDLAAIADMAGGTNGGFMVALADAVVDSGALEGLLASPGIATGVLGTGLGGGGTFGMRGRLARGRLVSASSAYHSVSAARMSFLGVLKVAAADTPTFAEAAAELRELTAGGIPDVWEKELAHKTEQWRMALGRAALKAERRIARDELEAAGRARDELPPMEPEEYARRKRELARSLPPADEAELALRHAAARQDIVSLLLVGLVRRGVHMGNSGVRGFFYARPLSRAAVAEVAESMQEHDEEQVRLKSAVKGTDGFFTTFFVSTWSRYVARWAARIGLSPNQVTVIALCVGIAAGTAFATGERAGYIAGAVLLYLSFVLDCVDGQLARYTRRYSKFGAYLDSVFDRAKEYVAFAGLGIGASSSEVWILAGAMLTLQTLRHSFDFSYGATDRQAIAETPQPPVAQAPDDALGRARVKSRDTLEPNLGLLERAATASELREAADDESNGRETERAVPTSLPRRILASWRFLDRIPGLIWLKKMAAFPIGERFAVICVTAALFTPRTTFIVLLAWGGFALLYTSTGRTLRTLAKWRSLPR
jgi:CDP-alcohol phosphatidyltransferase-like enzyme/MobA-like NTP transferase protein